MYYLELAPKNKTNIEANNFSLPQLNILLSMMRQCRKLRQGSVIMNLVTASLPDGFKIETNLKTGKDGKEYETYQVVKA